MNIKDKMMELNFDERKLEFNKEYDIEYFTFNRNSAIKALCYMIDNANKSIDIYHKPISNFNENLKNNKVIQALHNNKKVNIKYYTNFKTLNELEIIKKHIGENVNVINLDLGPNVDYHHKEINIDDKYVVITSLNFLTNNIIDDINHRSFWLENFSIWVKRSEN